MVALNVAGSGPNLELTKRWTYLRPHKAQLRLWFAESRFRVVPAGRRSGKTELAKRFVVLEAITFSKSTDGWFVCAAPTHKQARQIYWKDLKAMVPEWALLGAAKDSINETDMIIRLWNGAELQVMGLDQPARIEGRPLDGIVLDEYGNMKEQVWGEHVRPALDTVDREGWAWLIGVPEGRNHYYDVAMRAREDDTGEWSYHHWKSKTVISKRALRAARRELDRRTFRQEYEGDFVTFRGRAYYEFDIELHGRPLRYNKLMPLIFCFDFNREPGVAVVCQEGEDGTYCIDEVYIETDSNTPMVCGQLASRWGHHKGDVYCYGDATGGAKGSAKILGSDWALVKSTLRKTFGTRLHIRVPDANPAELVRVNSVNSRLRTVDGDIFLHVDPENCPMLIRDLEGVRLKDDGSGEIDKGPKADKKLTHLTDALGYYIVRRHSIAQHLTGRRQAA